MDHFARFIVPHWVTEVHTPFVSAAGFIHLCMKTFKEFISEANEVIISPAGVKYFLEIVPDANDPALFQVVLDNTVYKMPKKAMRSIEAAKSWAFETLIPTRDKIKLAARERSSAGGPSLGARVADEYFKHVERNRPPTL